MVDRIERPESDLYRVLEADKAGDEPKGKKGEEEEPREPDQFRRKGFNLSKKLGTTERMKPSRLFGGKEIGAKDLSAQPDFEEPEGLSWTWRLKHTPLVALGILDFNNIPRWGMLAFYLLGLAGLFVSLILLVQLI